MLFFYGQNITAELINCIEEQLQCNTSSFGIIMLAVIFAGTVIVCFFGGRFCMPLFIEKFCPLIEEKFSGLIQRLNPRNEEKSY